MEIIYSRVKIICVFLLTFLGSIASAAPPPLPISGDLIDQSGQPLNGTVTLAFSLLDSENGNELWSEVHDNVSVLQGRFAVLLGSKKDLLKNDGSTMDFTQKKYIKVQVTRKDQKESYTLTPPLEYIPTLGAWQAETAKKAEHANESKHANEAENTTTFDGHKWNEIETTLKAINEDFDRKINEIKVQVQELEAAKNLFANQYVSDLANIRQENIARVPSAIYAFAYSEEGGCPPGWADVGAAGFIHDGRYITVGDNVRGTGWYWTHPRLCKKQ